MTTRRYDDIYSIRTRHTARRKKPTGSAGKGEPLRGDGVTKEDMIDGMNAALEILKKNGKLRRGIYPDGTVYYRFNGKLVNSIDIMRLAGRTRERGK